MDLIYGNDTKRRKIENDLPIHLPNAQPTTVKLPSIVEAAKELTDTTATASNSSTTLEKPTLIQGTDISLQSQEDIEEWIKQRKLNWMKRISNNRELPNVEEKKVASDNPRGPRQNRNNNNNGNGNGNRRQQSSSYPNQRNQSQSHNQDGFSKDRFNLNKTLIQREFMDNENKDVLNFIKELFDKKILE